MKIILEKEEVIELTETVKALRNPTVTTVWNSIFGKEHLPEIELEVSDKVYVTISKNISVPMLTEMKKHGSSFGSLLQSGFSLSIISRWKRALNEFAEDMLRVFLRVRRK